jgi:hypothetical protein
VVKDCEQSSITEPERISDTLSEAEPERWPGMWPCAVDAEHDLNHPGAEPGFEYRGPIDKTNGQRTKKIRTDSKFIWF